MNIMKFFVLASLTLCMSLAFAGPKEDAGMAIKEAKAAQKKAGAAKYEWRDTGKLIKKAEEAMKAKDYKKAVSLAKFASFQGDAAVKQQKVEMHKKKYGL